MLNRVTVSGYISSSVVANRRPNLEYKFRVYIRGKPEGMCENMCYMANIIVMHPKVIQHFPGNLERGDFVIIEGELMSIRDEHNQWSMVVNAYCIYNVGVFLEANIGDARVRRQEQIAELYKALLAEENKRGADGLDIF